MLGLSGRHRIAEAMLQDFIRDISKDRTSLVLSGWDFADPKKAAADLRALGARWAREDRKSSKDGKGGAQS